MKVENDMNKETKKKKKHILKQLNSIDNSEGVGILNTNEWESVDMKKQLYPIGHYITDREEMVRQMFSIIQGDRLKNMLPPVLKDMDLDELKADCLIHLVGMSSKRIKAILAGQDLDASSEESDTDDDDSKSLTLNHNTLKNKAKGSVQNRVNKRYASSTSKSDNQKLEDNCSVISGDDTLEIGLTQSDLCDDLLDSNDESKSRKIKRRKLKHAKVEQPKRKPQGIETSTIKCQLMESNDKSLKSNETDEKLNITTNDENSSEKKGKTLLEILELEMRARAIRALLQHDDSPKALEPDADKDVVIINDANDVQILPEEKPIDLTSNDDPTEIETAVEVIEIDHDENDENENEQRHEIKNSNEEIVLLKAKSIKEERVSPEVKRCDVSSSTDKDGIASENNSWAQRWLEKKSKDVKRLVSTSKMCTTIRNKMKTSSKRLRTELSSNENVNLETDVSMPTEFKGSIEEYNMLTAKSATSHNKKEEILNSSKKIVSSENVSNEKATCEENVT